MTNKQLQILQMNTHKAKAAAMDLINEDWHRPDYDKYDVICIQEPWIDYLGNARAGFNWHLLYPTDKLNSTNQSRAITLINKRLPMDNW
jgi:hypothetical protein